MDTESLEICEYDGDDDEEGQIDDDDGSSADETSPNPSVATCASCDRMQWDPMSVQASPLSRRLSGMSMIDSPCKRSVFLPKHLSSHLELCARCKTARQQACAPMDEDVLETAMQSLSIATASVPKTPVTGKPYNNDREGDVGMRSVQHTPAATITVPYVKTNMTPLCRKVLERSLMHSINTPSAQSSAKASPMKWSPAPQESKENAQQAL